MSIVQHERRPRSPVAVIADWWHCQAHKVVCPSDLAACSPHDVGQIAADVGLTTDDLRRVVRHGSRAVDLLLRRMAALNLDPAELAKADRATLLDLERVCMSCSCKHSCRRDLACWPDDAMWEDYCPNVATLKMLDALPRASRREW